MTIVRTLSIFLAMHAGFGIVQLAVLYFSADIATYGGESGFLEYTPLSALVSNARDNSQAADPLDFPGLFGRITSVGDTVYGLLSFDYGIVTDITPADGMVHWVAVFFRLISWFSTAALTLAIAQFIFSSGILQSTAGLAMVIGGVGVTGVLTALGVVL